MQERIGDRVGERLVDAHIAADYFKLDLFSQAARRNAPTARGCPAKHFSGRHQAQLEQPFFQLDKPAAQIPRRSFKRQFVRRTQRLQSLGRVAEQFAGSRDQFVQLS